jgi:hypothetical protein
MSTFIETISKGETISRGQTKQITDLQVVCLMTLLGLALIVTLISLGFGADVVQGLTS